MRGIISLACFLGGAGATGAIFGVAASRAGDYDDFKDASKTVDGEKALIEERFGPGITKYSDSIFNQPDFNAI